MFHANGIRYIADTGDSSLVGMGTVNWFEDGVQVFYPNAYHLVGALVLRLSGADVPTVLNAHALLLPGMCALAVVALVHRFGGGAVLAVAAAACSVAVTSFYDMLWRGPLLPFATGVALLPLAAVLLADLLDATGGGPGPRAGLLFAAALVGLISLNPAVLFSAVLFALPSRAAVDRPTAAGCARSRSLCWAPGWPPECWCCRSSSARWPARAANRWTGWPTCPGGGRPSSWSRCRTTAG